MIHDLRNVDAAVATVRVTSPSERKQVISDFLKGDIDYNSETGKGIGSRRALFCSALSSLRLWPER